MSGIEIASNSDDIVDLGEEHHKAGRLQEAESYYRHALEVDPGHPGALYLLANIAYDDGRLPFATQLTDELLRDEPNDAEAWHLLGMIAYKAENHARASECFKKALAIQPAFARAEHSLGNALSKQGENDAALASFQRAVALNPAFAEAHCALGDIFRTQNNIEEALSSYQQAINLKLDFTLAYEGIGGILLAKGEADEAIAIFRKAIAHNADSAAVHVGLGIAYLYNNQDDDAAFNFEHAISLDPHCLLAYFNLGNILHRQGKFSAAATSYEHALTLNPQDTRLMAILARTYLHRLHERDKAVVIYRRWLTLEPDNPVARHHLAASTGEAVPARADDAYVEDLFDDFAESFDVALGMIKYRGPQLLAEALQRTYGSARKQLAVLDAGCGTGLSGPLVVEYAAQLTGVDLSAGMLAKAKLRNVYDALIKAELTAYMQSQANAFDVILSADTLIYFGALESLFASARTAIRDGGYLFFTVEVLTSDDADTAERGFFLNPEGRYSHSEAYLRHTLSEAGFTIVAIESAILRYEFGEPVQGLVLSCRAAGDDINDTTT